MISVLCCIEFFIFSCSVEINGGWHFFVTIYRFLPPEIASLKKLQELDLSFNKLKNLPNCITELGALKFLKVTNNKLVDLPSGISSLRCLESLDLSNNRLTSLGSVKLVSMLTLQYLNLQVYSIRTTAFHWFLIHCYVLNLSVLVLIFDVSLIRFFALWCLCYDIRSLLELNVSHFSITWVTTKLGWEISVTFEEN